MSNLDLKEVSSSLPTKAELEKLRLAYLGVMEAGAAAGILKLGGTVLAGAVGIGAAVGGTAAWLYAKLNNISYEEAVRRYTGKPTYGLNVDNTDDDDYDELDDDIHISKRTTREKLLSYLSAESVKNNSLSFDIPYDRQQLADFLCVERAAMSVELSKLQKEGMLKTKKNHFELPTLDLNDLDNDEELTFSFC